MFRQRYVIAAVVLLTAGLAMACTTGKERQRPLQTSPIGDSLAQVRQQLEGSWDLVTLEVHPPGGQPVRVNARGVLVYDAYGNLEISGTINDAALAKIADSGVLAFKGRAVIDVAGQQLRLLDVQTNVTEATPAVSPEKTRRYQFDGGLLRLTSLDKDGRVSAVVTWKKR
jgi:hypothetical protein